MYLKGVSTNDFSTALQRSWGKRRRVVCLNDQQAEAGLGSAVSGVAKKPLESEEYAYVWADGVYFNVRLEEERSCILVVIGANYQGKKNYWLFGMDTGKANRAGKNCCLELKSRGLQRIPKLGDCRWGARLLESPSPGVSHNASSTLLDAQEFECAG